MNKICGVYRITNQANGKKYIGQSRNIYNRWKQHTGGLQNGTENNESLIRQAFAKYGLNEQVSKPGIYENFVFEVLEECQDDQLLEREYFYIRTESPEYNLSRQPPNPDFIFRKRESAEEKLWVQYHNFEKFGGYPGIYPDGGEPRAPLSECQHYISTKKREAIKSLGDNVLLIMGKKLGKKKSFFAWSVMIPEELEFFEDEELSFNLIGTQKYFTVPIFLNPMDGFQEFMHRQGHFAFGFQNVKPDPWSENLQRFIENGPFEDDNKISWRAWVDKFETENGIVPNNKRQRESKAPLQPKPFYKEWL